MKVFKALQAGQAQLKNLRKEDLLKGYTDEEGNYHEAEFEHLVKGQDRPSLKTILKKHIKHG